MSPTLIDFLVLIVAGIIGGYALGFAVKEHRLGPLKSLVAGAVGGAGAYFLQSFIPLPSLTTTSGNYSAEDSPVGHLFTMALIGLIAGGILALVLGFVIAETAKHRP